MPNLIVSTPPDTKPVLYGMRVWFWSNIVFNEHRAATLRWRRNNATKQRRCQCGKPADIRITDEGDVIGSCRPYWWVCNEHEDVPLTVPWSGGRPLTGQSPDECSWSTNQTTTRIITECGCGTHVGQLAKDWKFTADE